MTGRPDCVAAMILKSGFAAEGPLIPADKRISDDEKLWPGASFPAKAMLGPPVAEMDRILSKNPLSPFTVESSPTAAINSTLPLLYRRAASRWVGLRSAILLNNRSFSF